MSDDNTGAIDSDWSDSEKSYEERLEAALADVQTEPMAGGLALDLVTRQPLLVRRVVAESLGEYYEAEGFDLGTYGVHPYLPVSADNRVLECVYISDITAESLGNFGNAKTYDFPAGRLAHVPVEEAWTGGEVDSL